MADGQDTGSAPVRVIRVFSSAFRDRQVEREELVKRIFLRLRKPYEERGVTRGEANLRRGYGRGTGRRGSAAALLPGWTSQHAKLRLRPKIKLMRGSETLSCYAR